MIKLICSAGESMKLHFSRTIRSAVSIIVAATMCTACVPQAAFASQSLPTSSEESSTWSHSSGDDVTDLSDDFVANNPSDPTEDPDSAPDASQVDADATSATTENTENAEEIATDPATEINPIHEAVAPTIDCYVNERNATVDVRAHGGSFDTASAVRFAVWSAADGQDDLKWYSGTRLGADLWGLTFPLSNHRSYGSYIVDAFETQPQYQFIAEGSFGIASPTADIAITQTDAQIRHGVFSVVISNVSKPEAVSAFRVPVWSEEGGQDDLVWYDATKLGKDSWQVEVPCVGGKRSAGDYNAHLYLASTNGFFTGINSVRATVDATPSEVTATLAPNEMSATLTFTGAAAVRSQRVQFPTWSDMGGQDDLVWYEGARAADGSWSVTVDIPRHATAGEYISHVYSTNETGMGSPGAVRFEVSPISATAEISSTDNGKFTVTITIENSPSGVKQIQVPTWTDARGQDDIVWHGATNAGNNAWNCEINASDHNGEDGQYISHVYATSGNGITAYVDMCRTNMTCRNYAFITGAIGSGYRNILIKHPNTDDVKIAVWTDEGGQDDIAWYARTFYGESLYGARIDCRGMKHAGTAIAHIYVSGSHLATINFWVSGDDLIPPEYRQMHDRIQGVGSATNYLIAVDTSRCIVGIFTGSQGSWTLSRSHACAPGKPSTPTVKGYFSVTGKGYVFGNEKGYSCYYWTQFYGDYLFHSILYNPGTFRVQDPTMGRQVSHGCVRLELENAKWIYDNIPYGTRVVVY